MKILQLDPVNLTPYYNMAICAGLAEAGCEVEYVTSQYLYDSELSASDRFTTAEIYFRGLNLKHLIDYPRVRQAARGIAYPLGHGLLLAKIMRNRPDIVHIQWSRLPDFDYWLMRQLQRQHIPIVHTVHDIVPLFDKGNFRKSLARVYETADRLIVHADANARDLLKTYPCISPDRVRILPLIRFDNPPFPTDANQVSAREMLHLPQGVPIIAFFGLIRESKGLDTLYDAFIRLLSAMPSAHLLVAGHANSPAEKRLLGLFANHANIYLHSGYVPTGDIWKYHLAADVFVFPYREIYQSAALITAMGFGCPVIVTDVGGMPETLDGNGWIVPRDNPLALSQAMTEALFDMDRLKRMGQRSLELIETRHSRAFIASQLIAVYRELIEAKTK